MKKIILFCFLITFFHNTCFAENPGKGLNLKPGLNADWDRYISSDLQALIDTHSEFGFVDFSQPNKMNLNALAVSLPYRIKVEYQNEFRPISQEKMKLLDFLAKSGILNETFINLFETEMLVKDGSNFYWFPVQKFLIHYFKKELSKGAQVNLYSMFAGTVLEADKIQWVFIVNEFETLAR